MAAAFNGMPQVQVFVLFPKGRISPRQEKQLTCWGGNIKSFAVSGSFDDCQKLVKTAFADGEIRKKLLLTSANSISLGRLLPQITYYAFAATVHGCRRFIIPTGNLGNAVAAFYARAMGFAIDRIDVASNANRAVVEYYLTGANRPQPTLPTLANAMDVGAPSNLERLIHLIGDPAELKLFSSATSVSDAEIRAAIGNAFNRYGYIAGPHTATAFHVAGLRGGGTLVATAPPAKFAGIVEPVIGHKIDVPDSLARLLNRPANVTELPDDFKSFKELLLSG